MVLLSNLLAGLALLLTASSAPLTVPLGTSRQSLTVAEDGESLTIAGQTITISQLLSSLTQLCSVKGSSRGSQGHGNGSGIATNHGSGANSSSASTTAKAIYFMTNAANNSIVSLKVASDGTLSDGSITATGGAGMSGIDSTGAPAAPDSLFSQGAVKVVGNVSVKYIAIYGLN